MRLLALQKDLAQWLTRESADVSARYGDAARTGLAVYLNNYRSQLMACLAAGYPAVRAYLGEVAFESAAATHIDAAPPHDWTLDAYGHGFPATLEKIHSPLSGELARLELGLALAFVGPDAEPVDAAGLRDVDWDEADLRLSPTLALLPVTFDVGALWSAIIFRRAPPAKLRLETSATIAIWRRAFEPKFRMLAPGEADVLHQLRMRRSYGDVCRSLVERMGERRGVARAAEMLAQWLTDGLIVGIESARTVRIPNLAYPELKNMSESRTGVS